MGDSPRPDSVSAAVHHFHGDVGLAAGDKAYRVVVIPLMYLPVLLRADQLVILYPDGDGRFIATQLDTGRRKAVIVLAVAGFQDESRQASELPRSLA